LASCLQNKAAEVTTENLTQYLTAQRIVDSLLALILVSLSCKWLAQPPLLQAFISNFSSSELRGVLITGLIESGKWLMCRLSHHPLPSLQLHQSLLPPPLPSRPQLPHLRSPLQSRNQSRAAASRSRSRRPLRNRVLPLISWFLSHLSTRIALLLNLSDALQHQHHRYWLCSFKPMILLGISQPVVRTFWISHVQRQLPICLSRTNGCWHFVSHGVLAQAGWIAELAALH